MNYYKNNVNSLILTNITIPKILLILILALSVIIIYILRLEVYDTDDVYAIKYKDQDYLEIILPVEASENISKYEYLEYNKEKHFINRKEILTPKTEQLYNNGYNTLSMHLNNYENIPEDIVIKVKLLKNKQSIFKKIFMTR